MSGPHNNGWREEITMGAYTGKAGILDRGDGRLEVAFRGKLRDVKEATTATVGGKPYAVSQVDASGYIDGIVVATLTAVTAPG